MAAYPTGTWPGIPRRRSMPERNIRWWERVQDGEDRLIPGHTLTGYVQCAGGNKYGSFVTTHVNGQEAPQRELSIPT